MKTKEEFLKFAPAVSPAALGVLVAHFLSEEQVLQLTAKELTTTIGIALTLLWMMIRLLLFYRNKVQKKELVSWARSQGRLICECSAVGEIMCITPESAGKIGLVVYACPKCKNFKFCAP